VMAALTPRVPRRRLLLILMVGFIIGQVFCALAPSYETLLGARLLIACGHGLFFGTASVIAGDLMPEKRGFAVSMIFFGVVAATIIGVPAGAAIGNEWSWRATFWVIGACAVPAALALALTLPRTPASEVEHISFWGQVRALSNQRVYLAYVFIIFYMTGSFVLQTYLVPLMTDVSGIPLEQTPGYLMLFGVGGFVGNFAGGRLADWKLMPTLIGLFAVQFALMLLLFVTSHSPLFLAINIFAVGAFGFAWATHATNRVVQAAKGAEGLAATLSSSAFNIGIAAGALAGGELLKAGFTYDQLPLASAGLIAAAIAVAVLSLTLDRRPAPGTAGQAA
jgi:DHA1 family inner membrane transport protein